MTYNLEYLGSSSLLFECFVTLISSAPQLIGGNVTNLRCVRLTVLSCAGHSPFDFGRAVASAAPAKDLIKS